MQIARRVLFGLLCSPFFIVLLVGVALVAVTLPVLYLLTAIAYPERSEWSA